MVIATFAALRTRTFDALLAARPEEATSLGLTPAGPLLSTCGPEGPTAELAVHRETLRELGRVDVASLDPRERAELDVMQRFARFRLHLAEQRREHRSDLELSLLPASSTLHAASLARDQDSATAWDAVAARADALAEALRAREEALGVGLAEGRAAQPELAAFFAERAIPWMAEALVALPGLTRAAGAPEEDRAASPASDAPGGRLAATSALSAAVARAIAALRRHAEWIAREVVPAAGRAPALDREEHALRLALCWGITTSAEELEAEAEEAIRDAHEAVLAHARGVAAARGEAVHDLADAAALLHALLRDTLGPDDDLAASYGEATERALGVVRRDGLFHLGDELAFGVEVAHGRPWIGGAINWPAPLFAKEGKARVLLGADPKAHPRLAVDNLAAHEGLPGHGLESLAFRRAFAGRSGPVLMLGVHDDLMQATKWVGPMLRIEGHAVYVEELLLEHGHHGPQGALFVEACKALRAARVCADLDLHVHGRTLAETAQRFAARSLFPLGWAEGQALRYLRVPLQCAAYHLGGRAVRRSVAELRRRTPGLALADAHERLFALGPVPPGLLDP